MTHDQQHRDTCAQQERCSRSAHQACIWDGDAETPGDTIFLLKMLKEFAPCRVPRWLCQ